MRRETRNVERSLHPSRFREHSTFQSHNKTSKLVPTFLCNLSLFIYAVLLFTLVLSSIQQSFASSSTLRVEIVRLTERGEKPVEGVKCAMFRINGNSFSKKTSEDGTAKFTNKTPGKYFMRFQSEKFRKEYKEWALPLRKGPINIENGRNSLKIICKKGARVRGVLAYEGDIDVSEASVSSNKSQQKGNVAENGEFHLSGLVPDEQNQIQFLLLSNRKSFSPTYRRILVLPSDRLQTGSTTDIGQITFPFAGKNEKVNIMIIGPQGNVLSKEEVRKIKMDLIIKNSNETIFFKGFGALLAHRSSSKEFTTFRLPAGKYHAWWRGYKDKKKYEFSISKQDQTTVKIKLPSEK